MLILSLTSSAPKNFVKQERFKSYKFVVIDAKPISSVDMIGRVHTYFLQHSVML
jgi:hypothetical protein